MISCINEIARSISFDCAHPIVGGYTGRGVLIPWNGVTAVSQDDSNPRKVLGITIRSGATICGLDNTAMTTPLEGSSTTGNADAGFAQYVKVVSGRILTRGAQNSADLVEPLTKSVQGFIAILEKKDKVGDGSYEVIGLLQPLRCADPTTVVRNENENGGSISFSLQATEQWFEVAFVPTPESSETQWQASRAAFEALLEGAV